MEAEAAMDGLVRKVGADRVGVFQLVGVFMARRNNVAGGIALTGTCFV
jgi:hypothetical protein